MIKKIKKQFTTPFLLIELIGILLDLISGNLTNELELEQIQLYLD